MVFAITVVSGGNQAYCILIENIDILFDREYLLC
jgi:hypothetical protein